MRSSATCPTGTSAPLSALAERRDRADLAIEVADLERAQLRHAEARRVHEVDHRAVADAARACRAAAPRGGGRPPRTTARAAACARPWGARRARSDRSSMARSRTRKRKKPRSAESCRALERADLPRRDAGDHEVEDHLRSRCAERRRRPRRRRWRRDLAEVARVGLERVPGERALDAQVIEIAVDPAVEARVRRPIHTSRIRARSGKVRFARRRAACTIAASSARGSSSRMSVSPTSAACARVRGDALRRRRAP